jgi:hypothetical protein
VLKLRLFRRRPKAVTVPVWRGGRLTMPEPAWCTGHADAVPEHPVDFRHTGVEVPLYVHAAGGRTFEILAATVVHDPFSSADVLPRVSVDLGADGYREFTRAELLELADGLVQHAAYLREFADEVEELRRALDEQADQ